MSEKQPSINSSTAPLGDGGPAFPVPIPAAFVGMTLRDYFAAKAFERLVQAHIDQSVDDLSKPDIACEAYSYADAMLAARKATAINWQQEATKARAACWDLARSRDELLAALEDLHELLDFDEQIAVDGRIEFEDAEGINIAFAAAYAAIVNARKATGKAVGSAPDLLEALKAERGLIESAQAILTACLRPDGISEREAVSQLLEVLGGPLQQEVKARTEAAIAKAEGKDGAK